MTFANAYSWSIPKRLKLQAEKIIAEEQAGFKAGRSTTEQIFNLRILCEKYLQHQQDLYHNLIDFKKAFDKVWHAALWATMKKYNISTNLIQVIKNLYNKASSAVLFNGAKGDWFRTTVGVRQGRLLSTTLFNIFLERIMTKTSCAKTTSSCTLNITKPVKRHRHPGTLPVGCWTTSYTSEHYQIVQQRHHCRAILSSWKDINNAERCLQPWSVGGLVSMKSDNGDSVKRLRTNLLIL